MTNRCNANIYLNMSKKYTKFTHTPKHIPRNIAAYNRKNCSCYNYSYQQQSLTINNTTQTTIAITMFNSPTNCCCVCMSVWVFYDFKMFNRFVVKWCFYFFMQYVFFVFIEFCCCCYWCCIRYLFLVHQPNQINRKHSMLLTLFWRLVELANRQIYRQTVSLKIWRLHRQTKTNSISLLLQLFGFLLLWTLYTKYIQYEIHVHTNVLQAS